MGDKPTTILIVDDDKTVIEQLVTHFRRRNYEPIATANPAIVKQTLEAFEVHLILLDLRMERLNGYEVLQNLRANNVKTPVLIITAYFQDERERLEQVGITAEDVIEKPFRDFSKIEASINRKLNRIVAPSEVGSDYEDEIYYDNRTKVVLVDDEDEINEILAEILRERKYEVITFRDGQAALDFFRVDKDTCQIAVVDMSLPKIPGHKLIEEVKKFNKMIRFIPVSAKYVDEMKEKLRSVGFDSAALVTKPFDLPTLIEQIKVMATEANTLGTGS
ncbi:MAG: response regulator [Candidatus Omnitrophota bacterium]|nr:response regulator [Candidatus Omnitrophota bacterium]